MKKKNIYLILFVLAVISFVAFSPILRNDFINLDDVQYITENPHIQSGISAESVRWALLTSYFTYWHPLAWLSHMLDWRVFGANASGHHLISLLWHIGSVLLLFLFLNKTTRSFWPSVLVAALFALHPLRVESVAWAAERKDVLSVFFGLASLYLYAFYVENLKISRYLLCLMLFVLSLMSKPMLVTMPFLLLLLDYWPLNRWRVSTPVIKMPAAENISGPVKKKKKRAKAAAGMEKNIVAVLPATERNKDSVARMLLEKIPFLLLAVLVALLTIRGQHDAGAMSSLQQISISDRMLNAMVSYASYLGDIFWPVHLAVFYPYEHALPIWKIAGAVLLVLGISAAVIYWIRKIPFLAVGWFWYLGVLVPVIGLLQAGMQARADRFTYFPFIGIAIMVVFGIGYIWPKEKMRMSFVIPPVTLILVVLAFLSWRQCGLWKDSVTLFTYTLQVTEDNYVAHDSLGVALDAAGQRSEAFAHYRTALDINPLYWNAHYNIGNVYKEQGNMDKAFEHFREVTRLKPDFADAQNNAGIILELHYKRNTEAMAYYRKALEAKPDHAGFCFNLGMALMKEGKTREAVGYFRQAVDLDPQYSAARQALQMAVSKLSGKE